MSKDSKHVRDLLIEIGTEELPPKSLKRLSNAFTAAIKDGLEKNQLTFDDIKPFATPRRLSVVVTNLLETQPDSDVERRGPALAAAYDDEGCPTKAAQGFARSCAVEVEDLEKLETNKGTWLVFRAQCKGESAINLIPAITSNALDKLPIPKRMRWGDLAAEFVRPVHWVVMLFGDDVIDSEILGVRTGRETRGHRFHHPEPIHIPKPSEYEVLLESEGKVIADFDRRRQTVRAQVDEAAVKTGGNAAIDDALLDEVTSMVEWPVAVLGNFEQRFLEVPPEVLISTMKGHQKYFHIVDDNNHLMPHFITISNIESRDPGKVREGNERVIRPRFSDADFFWNQDRKTPLGDRLDSLKTVVFQKKLGTLFDKAGRIAKLSKHIADQLGADPELATRAGYLAKCDLMTEMVGEFPELQGVMGRYYASAHEPAEVADALDEHYMPRHAGDQLPGSPVGQAVAIADRIDTLIGIFGIGQAPTGDKDPFALRRAALGVLRITIEKQLDIDLMDLLEKGADWFDKAGVRLDKKTAEQVFNFMMERLRAYYLEQNIQPDVFEAVLAHHSTQPSDFNDRIHAVSAFRSLVEAESLAAANKRIGNILKKVGGSLPKNIDKTLHKEKEEADLFEQLDSLDGKVTPLLEKHQYTDALKHLAQLRSPVDNYFDKVMVMADDEKLRNNRIALLNKVHGMFMQVADISKLQG